MPPRSGTRSRARCRSLHEQPSQRGVSELAKTAHGESMKIAILGAGGGEVTGSCYHVQTQEANVLVDCGLFQGALKTENFNRIPKVGSLEKLNAVVLTHAHLDHTGRLPLLTRARSEERRVGKEWRCGWGW